MKGRTLERSIRRALAKSERIAQADRRFFARHPGRRYRVRLASLSEVEVAEGAGVGIEAGQRLYTVVRFITADIRLRAFFAASAELAGCAEDVADPEAEAIFCRIDKAGFTDRLARRAAEVRHAG